MNTKIANRNVSILLIFLGMGIVFTCLSYQTQPNAKYVEEKLLSTPSGAYAYPGFYESQHATYDILPTVGSGWTSGTTDNKGISIAHIAEDEIYIWLAAGDGSRGSPEEWYIGDFADVNTYGEGLVKDFGYVLVDYRLFIDTNWGECEIDAISIGIVTDNSIVKRTQIIDDVTSDTYLDSIVYFTDGDLLSALNSGHYVKQVRFSSQDQDFTLWSPVATTTQVSYSDALDMTQNLFYYQVVGYNADGDVVVFSEPVSVIFSPPPTFDPMLIIVPGGAVAVVVMAYLIYRAKHTKLKLSQLGL